MPQIRNCFLGRLGGRPDDPANDERVQAVNLYQAKDVFHQVPTEENREKVAEAKNCLSNRYKTVEEEALVRKIRRVENAADRCKNKESWNLVKDVTGRTKTTAELIEGGNAEEVRRG